MITLPPSSANCRMILTISTLVPRSTPAVGVDGLLVLTGVRTLYGLVPAQTGG